MLTAVLTRDCPKACWGVSTSEKKTVAVQPRGAPLNEMNWGRCQKLALVISLSWKSSDVRRLRLMGEPSELRVGTLHSLRSDRVG